MDENQKLPEVPSITDDILPPQPISVSSESAENINGHPFKVMNSASVAQLETPPKKSSKWKYFFIVLGVLQILAVGFFFWLVSGLVGVTGGEIIALYLYFMYIPAVGVGSVINIVGLLVYIIKRKTRGIGLLLSIFSLILSVVIVSYGAYNWHQLYATSHKYQEQSIETSQKRIQQIATDNAQPEITKEEAISLLKTCQLKGFYYTDQTKSEEIEAMTIPSAEASSTGIVLVKVDGKPYRVSIADRLISELVPIAREAQKTCVDPQFWHDGTYEQYKNGKWYFKNEVVNVIHEVKTKEDVLSLMKNCKVDYFIGYTGDVSVIKDTNTKAWLKNAEQSTSGIEISETATQTIVFASKATTAQLQDTARQYRQLCYSTKKLYIMIDDWVETEYPAGTWTKVKQ